MNSEDEIALLTAEINSFAVSQEWLPIDESEPIWSTWKRVRKPSSISAPKRSTLLRPIWEQCDTILHGILQNRNAYVFSRPVDPHRDGVINYLEVIKHPMDLGTVRQRLALQTRRRNEPLKPSMYRCPMELLADVNRVWENCFQYNPPGFEVRKMGEILKSEFDRRWKAMKIEESVQRINKQCGFEEDEEVKLGVSSYQHPLKEDPHFTKAPKKRKPGFIERERKPNQTSNPKDRKPRPKKEINVKEGVLNSPKKVSAEHSEHQIKKKSKSSIPSTTSKLDRLGGGGGGGGGIGNGNVKNKISKDKSISNRKDGVRTSGSQLRNSHRRVEENKMRRLIQSCQQPTRKPPPSQSESKDIHHQHQQQREWLPPIERGGGLQTSKMKSSKVQSSSSLSTSKPSKDNELLILKESLTLNEELKKSLKNLSMKSESEMSDFEVRRKLSQLLESVTLNAIQILTQTVLSKDPSFTSGESNLDLLEIKYVRHAVRSLLSAAAKKNKEKASLAAQAKQASSTKENPSPMRGQAAKKKRKAEEEGTPLATKTPRVSSPSPPWDRGLTHNRTVWEDAVGSCGITPCLNGKELDLTLRQESDGSNWEEAVPDDVEEGEIRN